LFQILDWGVYRFDAINPKAPGVDEQSVMASTKAVKTQATNPNIKSILHVLYTLCCKKLDHYD